jgi:hypothetical protein
MDRAFLRSTQRLYTVSWFQSFEILKISSHLWTIRRSKSFFKIYLLDDWLWSSKYLFKTFCLFGVFQFMFRPSSLLSISRNVSHNKCQFHLMSVSLCLLLCYVNLSPLMTFPYCVSTAHFLSISFYVHIFLSFCPFHQNSASC